MKRFTFLLLVLTWLHPLQAQENGIDQSSDLLIVPEGDKFLRWYGYAGRSYFVQVSDPNDHLRKWTWAPVIESGNDEEISYEVDGTADKGFFRLKYTDQVPGSNETLETADFDGDGLTNWDEINTYQTDPLNLDTDGDGLPDGWEVANNLDPNDATGVNGTDCDPDNDGLTNLQEYLIGTSPTVADNPGILQEAIANGDFSAPLLGTGLLADATWDYWAGVPGWCAVVGQNIEYQNVEPIATGNQYAELKADPEGHYGIKQQVGTRVGVTYLLTLDCKPRQDTTPGDNNFSIKIDGTVIQTIAFNAIVPWATHTAVFTASKVLTEISLVPDTNPNDTMGCLVDNVKLALITFITPAGDPVLSPVDAGTSPESIPDGANEFTFSNEPTGIITLTLKASVPGISSLPAAEQTKFTFEVDAIGNSTFAWDAANPQGRPSVSGDFITATATFTGLPQNNSDFGLKKARLKYDAANVGEAIFEVFFPRDATNHPLGQAGSANWFYYWQEGNVCGIPSDAIYDATNPGWFGWTQADQDSILRLCPSAPTIGGEQLTLTSAINIPGSDPPATYGSISVRAGGKGIQCVAETIEHELYHITMYADLGNKLDWDSDGVADSSEATLGGIVSSPLHPDTYNLSSLPGYEIYSEIADEEVRAMKKECDVLLPVVPLGDWANPGCQSANQHGPKP